MGACYLVEDTDVRRSYVLKIMHSSVAAKPEAVEAFDLEARGLIALHTCPNIVQAYQVDATSKGAAFYLMEVLSGLSLREILRRRAKLDPAVAIRIGNDIAKALVFAHDKAIVHCDLKPENVVIVSGADGSIAKLIDFGVMKAKLVRAGFHGAAGTPAYMSPEQIRGEDVDARADLFSLGVMLYEMFTGVHPFKEHGLSFEDAKKRIDMMPAPIGYVVDNMPWQILNPIDDILERLLAPKAKDRFSDASDVQVRLVRLRREVEKLSTGNVHAATTNPAGTPQDLIDQITGAIDENTMAPKTDPSIAVSADISDVTSAPSSPYAIETNPDRSPPQLAMAQTEVGPTHPPSRPLPPPAPDIAYVEEENDSYIRAAAAAQFLDESAPPPKPKPRATRESVASETVVEEEPYHRNIRRAHERAEPQRTRAYERPEPQRTRGRAVRLSLAALRNEIVVPLRRGEMPGAFVIALVMTTIALLVATAWLLGHK